MARDGVYCLQTYEDEHELERLVIQNSATIFGLKSVYFDLKRKVESRAKMRVTDGLLLDLNDAKNPKFWIVEIELARHDLYKDIEPQVRGFLRALKAEETLTLIRSTVYDAIGKNSAGRKLVREVGRDQDVHYFIDKVLRTRAGVVVVIDEQSDQLTEIVEELSRENEVRVMEFKTYRRGKKLLHSFTPLTEPQLLRFKEGLVPRQVLRLKFWGQLLDRAREKGITVHGGRSPTTDLWLGSGAGISGLSFTYLIWLKKQTGVELYIDTGDGKRNKRIFDFFHSRKERIERDFGGSLSWERLDDRRCSRVRFLIGKGGLKDNERDWPLIQDAMVDAMDRLSRAFTPQIRELPE